MGGAPDQKSLGGMIGVLKGKPCQIEGIVELVSLMLSCFFV
jgi:hypothetical protein